jgi:hypothetical protein
MVGLELHTVGPHSGTNPCPPPSCGHLVELPAVCRVSCACGLSITQMPTSWSLSSWIWGSSAPTGPLVYKFTGTLGAALTHDTTHWCTTADVLTLAALLLQITRSIVGAGRTGTVRCGEPWRRSRGTWWR